MMKRKTVFFDRDGVVNQRIIGSYVTNAEEFVFLPHIFEMISIVKNAGWNAILVTNQQGIGKGIMTENDLTQVHSYMQKGLREATGFCFDDIFYCTELEINGSYRRKPNPGMLLEAIDKWDIDADSSWMVGDRPTDALAGKKAGVRTILVGPYLRSEVPESDVIFANYLPALELLKLIIK